MSHFTLRQQPNCLNCGTDVHGRYCHICGQENIEPKESFWHLVTHFVYDVTHFDGKFFSSVKYLLLKPGFLSKEYIIGRRMSYLNPIKMYVFISAFFFLFFFSVINPTFNTEKKEREQPVYREVKSKIENQIKDLQENLQDKDNSEFTKKIMQDQVRLLQQNLQALAKDTLHLAELNHLQEKQLSAAFGQYGKVTQYDSAQNSLPAKDRDSWLKRITTRKIIQLQSKYDYNDDEFYKTFFEKFRHTFPQLLFISLPLFALLLKLLYIRKKSFFYVNHIIYTVHLYCAMYILLFIMLAVSNIEKWHYLSWLGYFTVPLVIYTIWYQYKSLKNFYGQSSSKTVVKYLLLLMMSSVVMTMLFVVFLIFSLFNL